MRNRPLWFRLGLAFGLVSLTIVVLTLVGGTYVARRTVRTSTCRTLMTTVEYVAATGAFDGPLPVAVANLRRLPMNDGTQWFLRVGTGEGGFRFLAPDGGPALLPGDAFPMNPVCIARKTGPGISGTPEGGEVAFATFPLDPGATVALVALRPMPTYADLLGAAVPIGIFVVLFMFSLASGIAKRITRPIDELREVAARIGAGELDAKVATRAPGELGALADDVNAMSDALLEARRREQEFLANVSHELRTPITSVLGFAEALHDGTVTDPDGIARVAGIVHAEATRLHRLADDVLTIARIGAGAFPIVPSDVDISEVAGQVVDANGPAAADGVTLRLEAEGSVPARTDPERLAQILTNLVTNAIRVCEPGATVTVAAGIDDVGRSWVSVRDEGPGIAASDLPHVFERAYLLRAQTTGGGHGLGLAIVRELCSRLGATIAVSSTPGRGTTFTVRFPTPVRSDT